MSMSVSSDLLIIGGGAAGMMAASVAAQQGLRVTVLEKNEKPGRKLYITGKGRCNVTNACDEQEFFRNVPRNPRFLYSALYGFPPSEVMAFFEQRGCELKVERGNRVFPVTDRAASIIDTLRDAMYRGGAELVHANAESILLENGAVCGVVTDKGEYRARAVLLATGGCSYPATGSTGDGYRMARELGHSMIEPVGSLVPLVEKGHFCKQMQGLALKNISLRLVNQKGKCVYEEFGELLFTHFGISGPVVLSASAHMKQGESYTVHIDLKPALDEKTLDARLLREFEQNQNRNFENALESLLPRTMIPIVVHRSGIEPQQKVHSITREQRRGLLELLKDFSVEIACKAPVEEAIVTSGGIKVSEVDPKTMQSKLVQGLYFAGEVLDVDAYTGGFNLQIAWSTAHAAAMAVAQQKNMEDET